MFRRTDGQTDILAACSSGGCFDRNRIGDG